jgi:hypothetical protein
MAALAGVMPAPAPRAPRRAAAVFLWAGDAADVSDFLAVVDAGRSAGYASVVATLPVRATGRARTTRRDAGRR